MIADYQPKLIGHKLDALFWHVCDVPSDTQRLLRYQTGALLFVSWDEHADRAHKGEVMKHRWRLGFWKTNKALAKVLTLKRKLP